MEGNWQINEIKNFVFQQTPIFLSPKKFSKVERSELLSLLGKGKLNFFKIKLIKSKEKTFG